jgi:hypothetical protein
VGGHARRDALGVQISYYIEYLNVKHGDGSKNSRSRVKEPTSRAVFIHRGEVLRTGRPVWVGELIIDEPDRVKPTRPTRDVLLERGIAKVFEEARRQGTPYFPFGPPPFDD